MAIATTSEGRSFVAAARAGSGRLVHFGADDMVHNCFSYGNLSKLVTNAAVWASGKTAGIRIASSAAGWTSGVVAHLVQEVRCIG